MTGGGPRYAGRVLHRRPRAPLPFERVLRDGDELFELSERGHYLLLSEAGLFVGRDRGAQAATFVPWDAVTHLTRNERSLWVGTRNAVHLANRSRESAASFDTIAAEIERRIGQRPGGMAQLARMREIDGRAQRARAPLVSLGLVAVCIAVHLLQISDPFVREAGQFWGELVGEGELWRLVTAHFLHDETWFYVSPLEVPVSQLLWALPAHITLNCIGALLLGYLIEHSLGRARTIFVIAVAGLSSLTVSALASPAAVVGASGLVLGMAGAVLALELRVPDRLPAGWRLPRRLMLIALVLDTTAGFFIDGIAVWAHIGGFLGGYFAARPLAPGLMQDSDSSHWLRPVAAMVGLVVAVSFGSAGALVLRSGWAFERHARNVLALEEVGAVQLNNLAWLIATEASRPQRAAASALELAERAVEKTDRANPDYLDTLAEVQFLFGDPEAAITTIDEAIEIAPWDDYFREQRDRFIGLRPADERPQSPDLPWFRRGPVEPAPWDDGSGVDI